MKAIGVPAGELRAWLGPAISQEHFEVGEEVRETFLNADTETASPLSEMNARGRWQADLAWLARLRLASLGLTNVQWWRSCTYADRERFFSHRREAGRAGASRH